MLIEFRFVELCIDQLFFEVKQVTIMNSINNSNLRKYLSKNILLIFFKEYLFKKRFFEKNLLLDLIFSNNIKSIKYPLNFFFKEYLFKKRFFEKISFLILSS